MSVQTQIDRLTKAKSDLKVSITNKGVAVSDDALLSDYPALVDSIQTGSDLKVQDSKAVSYTANGSYDVSPDSGYDGMAKVTVDVNVAGGSSNVFDLSLGGKLGYSTFSTLPYNIINTSQVTDMIYMFGNCGRLTSLDLSSFNTSQVTNMRSMFRSCYSLTSLDLSSFDTSQVTDMNNMFGDCGSLTSLDLSSFDTSQVTDMSNMFSYCDSFASLDLSSFDTSQVTDMTRMFNYDRSLTSLDLSNFDTSQVTNMGSMFKSCDSLTTVKVINCNDATKQKILTQLQTDLPSHTWTLGEDGIITRS